MLTEKITFFSSAFFIELMPLSYDFFSRYATPFYKILDFFHSCPYLTTMEKVKAQEFWNRVDFALQGQPLKYFCEDNGLSIDAVYAQRLKKILPKMKDIEVYADKLGVSLVWLLFGVNPPKTTDPKLQEVIDILSTDKSKLSLVRIALGLTP